MLVASVKLKRMKDKEVRRNNFPISAVAFFVDDAASVVSDLETTTLAASSTKNALREVISPDLLKDESDQPLSHPSPFILQPSSPLTTPIFSLYNRITT